MRSFSLILLMLLGISSFASKDSLLTALKSANDSMQVVIRFELANELVRSNEDSAILVINEALEIAQINEQKGQQAECHGWLGYLIENKGLIAQALNHNHTALSLYENILRTKSFGKSRQLPDSLIPEYESYLGMCLNNIGYNYRLQGDNENALKTYHRSLAIRRKNNDERGIANSLNNIAHIHKALGELDTAIAYFEKSVELHEKNKMYHGLAYALSSLASVHHVIGDTVRALEMHEEALELERKHNIRYVIINTLCNIGKIYTDLKKFDKAKPYLDEAQTMALALNNPDLIRQSSLVYYHYFKAIGNSEKALSAYELHIQMRDSIKNEETQKATIRQQTKYEFEKEQLVKEQEEKEAERILEAQETRRNNLQYSLIFLVILLFFGLILGLGFIRISSTVAEGLIFFAFLIFFEFLLVLGDPFIESITNGEPIYKLLANAVLAGLIFPLHAFFERVLKNKLVKN